MSIAATLSVSPSDSRIDDAAVSVKSRWVIIVTPSGLFFKDLSMRFKPVVYPSERLVTMDYSNITCQNVTETIVLYPAHQPKLSILQGNIIAIYLTVVGKFLTFWYIPPPKKKWIFTEVWWGITFFCSSSNYSFLMNRFLASLTREQLFE